MISIFYICESKCIARRLNRDSNVNQFPPPTPIPYLVSLLLCIVSGPVHCAHPVLQHSPGELRVEESNTGIHPCVLHRGERGME